MKKVTKDLMEFGTVQRAFIGVNIRDIETLTEIKNFVELRHGTIVGNNCLLDSRVTSSGNCVIGNNVILR